MTLSAGSKLGPYEIQSPLGAGGMGEVYRARDTRLDRSVAIKILPAQFSCDPVRKQRFEREARTISGLNHPNICTLHDIGHQDGTDCLVMECVKGETLAKRLEKGPLSLDQALKYRAQIADALDKAHRSGVVHRDLKPGNIMLTSTGAKLLDFGLAKPIAEAFASGQTLSVSPAKSRSLTAEGSIIGTVQYMSPEQLEGKETDARSDLFSFGAVLYEIVTGNHAFDGKSQASVIAAIMEHEPRPISAFEPLAPAALDRLIHTCLAKDPEERIQTAHDVKLQLQWIAEGGSQAGVPAPVAKRRRTRERLGWVIAATVSMVSGLMLVVLYSNLARELSSGGVTRFTISLSKGQELSVDTTVAVALSPDGKKLAYVAAENGIPRLYLRSLDEFDAVAVPESEGVTFPFFSEDSQWVAFFSQGKLKKVPASAGTPLIICDVPSFSGGTWTPDGRILFSIPGLGSSQVSASGGTPEKLSIAKKYALTRPVILPGGQWILFTHFMQPAPEVWALSLRWAPSPQKPQANLKFMSVTILQTQESSNSFKINTYKAASQLLILNHLRRQLNPLDATLTQSRGEGPGLVSRESCMELEIVTSHLSPLLSASCALFRPTEASQLLCNQSLPHSFPCNGGGVFSSLLLTSLPPYLPELSATLPTSEYHH